MATIHGFSTYLQNIALNHLLRNQAFSPPAAIYLALFTTTPNEDGTGGVEVTGSSYARQAVVLTASTAGSANNNADVFFPVVTTSGYTVAGVGILDDLSAGNLLAGHAITPVAVAVGQQLRFRQTPADLTVTVIGGT